MSEYHVPAMPPPQKRARQTISIALKKLIVESVVSKGHSKADVAKMYKLSFSTVSTIIKKFEHDGQLSSSNRRGPKPRHRKLADKDVDTMLDYIAKHPAANIDEIREHLREQGLPQISATTTQRAIKDRCHCSLKRLHIDHDGHQDEQTIADRQRWIHGLESLALRGLSLNNAVFFRRSRIQSGSLTVSWACSSRRTGGTTR